MADDKSKGASEEGPAVPAGQQQQGLDSSHRQPTVPPLEDLLPASVLAALAATVPDAAQLATTRHARAPPEDNRVAPTAAGATAQPSECQAKAVRDADSSKGVGGVDLGGGAVCRRGGPGLVVETQEAAGNDSVAAQAGQQHSLEAHGPHHEPPPATARAAIAKAAELLRNADAVLIGAGAGMSVGSGLPTFTDLSGWAQLYPALAARGHTYETMATSRLFEVDPELAWGWYAQRMRQYANTKPHDGYTNLQRIVGHKPVFVVTSNVDGQFQASGFTDGSVYEIHGTVQRLQCAKVAEHGVWLASRFVESIRVDPETQRATPDTIPKCRAYRCEHTARPNVLLFGDSDFNPQWKLAKERKFATWLMSVRALQNVVVLEIGAGTRVPTIRKQCEKTVLDLRADGLQASLVRINPGDASPTGLGVGVAVSAEAALAAITQQLGV